MKDRLVFAAAIEDYETDPFNIHCVTTWEDEMSDYEIISAFISILDDIDDDERLSRLWEEAQEIRNDMHREGHNSIMLANN